MDLCLLVYNTKYKSPRRDIGNCYIGCGSIIKIGKCTLLVFGGTNQNYFPHSWLKDKRVYTL